MTKRILKLLYGLVFVLSASMARAAATYDAAASFDLTLISVTDSVGSPAVVDWSVLVAGFNDFEETFEDGLAAASTLTNIAPPVSLGVGDSVFQSSSSSGSATDGVAASIAYTFLEILVENNSTEVLTFTFNYESLADAAVSGTSGDGEDALAFALVDVLDDFGFVDILIFAEADLLFGLPSDSDSDISSFSFSLQPGEFNFVDALIESEGFASKVPEPTTLVLMAIGLASVGYKRHRSKLAALRHPKASGLSLTGVRLVTLHHAP